MSAPRVLIAEDDPAIVASLDFLMRRCGFETRLAADGAEALAAVADFRPRLVILDLMLPGVSGLEVCRRIRERPEGAATRILMLTARGAETDRAQGLAAGADDYLVKPFATQELTRRARAMIG